jgi:ABC-type lipoprotein release transport system permease subunit
MTIVGVVANAKYRALVEDPTEDPDDPDIFFSLSQYPIHDLGLAGALALTRLITSQLYGVSPTDPIVFVVMSLALPAATGLASYLPARRATRVDPLVCLRYE